MADSPLRASGLTPAEDLAELFNMIARRHPGVTELFMSTEFGERAARVYAAFGETPEQRTARIMAMAKRQVAGIVAEEARGELIPDDLASMRLRASGLSDDERVPSHVSQADIDWIEQEVGMGAGAWDMVAPDKIIAACWARLRAARATPPKGADEPTAEFFCARCLAPKRGSYRAFGATCDAGCGNTNDGTGRTFWLRRSEVLVARPTREEPNG